MTPLAALLLLELAAGLLFTRGQSIVGDDANDSRNEVKPESSLSNFYNAVGRSVDPISYLGTDSAVNLTMSTL